MRNRTLTAILALGVLIAFMSGCRGHKLAKDGCPVYCEDCTTLYIDDGCKPETEDEHYVPVAELDKGDCLCFTSERDDTVKIVFGDDRPIGPKTLRIAPGETVCRRIKTNALGEYYYKVNCGGSGGSGDPKVNVGGGGG